MAYETVLVEEIEALRLDYDDRCNELAEVHAEVRAAKLEAQELRLRLRAAGRGAFDNLEPANPQRGRAASASASAISELRCVITWLASCIELEPPAVFDANCDTCAGGRSVLLQRVAQWRLNCPGNLLLTVPDEVSTTILALLVRVRSKGEASAECFEDLLRRFDIVVRPACNTSADADRSLPVFLMVERTTSAGLMVGTWPLAPVPIVDAQVTRRKQRSSSCPSKRKSGMTVGDRVDVNYEGAWFAGAIQIILEGGAVYVQCDIDPPGVWTLAHAAEVRLARLAHLRRSHWPLLL